MKDTQIYLEHDIVCSFSSGRTSGLMVKKLVDELSVGIVSVFGNKGKPKYKKHLTKYGHNLFVVMTNTTKEREESLKFADKCDKQFGFELIYLEAIVTNQKGIGSKAKIVSYQNLRRNGEVFESLIQKLGIPNAARSKCSSELKTNVVRAFCKEIGLKKYWNAVGIRIDEPKRLNFEKAEQEKVFYPLATTFKVTRFDVNAFWAIQSFDLELKSYEGNCDMCWKKSKRKLMTIATENPKLTQWWLDIEKKYGYFVADFHNISDEQLPRTFFRDHESMEDIIEESKFPFSKCIDESKEQNILLQMQNWDNELDSNGGCVESCEPFGTESSEDEEPFLLHGQLLRDIIRQADYKNAFKILTHSSR